MRKKKLPVLGIISIPSLEILWYFSGGGGGMIPHFFHQDSYAHLLTQVRGRREGVCWSICPPHYTTCVLGDHSYQPCCW